MDNRSQYVLKELTVLIPLKDRLPFTRRLMSYMNSIRVPFKIFIADGGKDEGVPSLLSKKENFPFIDYEYMRYPYDQTYHDYHRKMADALSRINTTFVAIFNDDYFLIPDGLRESVSFLKCHPEYSACRGATMPFSVVTWSGHEFQGNVYGDAFWPRRSVHTHSIEDPTAYGRVQEHFLRYSSTYNDVHRTEQLKTFFGILEKINIEDIFLAELFLSFLTVASGKIKRMPALYLLRQRNTGRSCAADENRKNDIFERMLLESWSDDFTKFINTVSHKIAEIDKADINGISLELKKWYRAYVSNAVIAVLSDNCAQKCFEPVQLAEVLSLKFRSMIIKIFGKSFWEEHIYLMDISREHRKDARFIREFLLKGSNG